jgi:hypothetical protein
MNLICTAALGRGIRGLWCEGGSNRETTLEELAQGSELIVDFHTFRLQRRPWHVHGTVFRCDTAVGSTAGQLPDVTARGHMWNGRVAVNDVVGIVAEASHRRQRAKATIDGIGGGRKFGVGSREEVRSYAGQVRVVGNVELELMVNIWEDELAPLRGTRHTGKHRGGQLPSIEVFGVKGIFGWV